MNVFLEISTKLNSIWLSSDISDYVKWSWGTASKNTVNTFLLHKAQII